MTKSVAAQAETTRRCRRCGKDKPLSAFGFLKSREDRTNTICKRCNCEKVAASKRRKKERRRDKCAEATRTTEREPIRSVKDQEKQQPAAISSSSKKSVLKTSSLTIEISDIVSENVTLRLRGNSVTIERTNAF